MATFASIAVWHVNREVVDIVWFPVLESKSNIYAPCF